MVHVLLRHQRDAGECCRRVAREGEAARVCVGASQLFRNAGARAGEIIEAWQKAGVQDAAMTRSPLPLVVYVTATNIMLQKLIVLGMLWLLLGLFVKLLHKENPKPEEGGAKP